MSQIESFLCVAVTRAEIVLRGCVSAPTLWKQCCPSLSLPSPAPELVFATLQLLDAVVCVFRPSCASVPALP